MHPINKNKISIFFKQFRKFLLILLDNFYICCHMKHRLFFTFCFLCFFYSDLFSQKNNTKEFSILSDNDLYVSISQDKYYSNGLFFTYRFLKSVKNNSKIEKRIDHFQLGHMLYTPYKAIVTSPHLHDRPFAGYLFGEYGTARFYKSQNMVAAKLQVGVLGPSSKAEQVQNFIHGIYGFNEAVGWKYQIREAFALNLTVDYFRYLKINTSNNFDISSYNSLIIGTVFTHISTGFYSRIGFKSLQKTYNSLGLHSNLATNQPKKRESFIYLKPMIHYVLYDATIEGSFLNNSSPITYDVMPFKFTFEIGYRYAANRFNYGYTIHYHTKKLKSIRVKDNNMYGSIYVGYNFN